MTDSGVDPAPGDDSDDLLAAEYVLGGLPAAEQAAAALRADLDAAFARRVSAWEERLVPLAESFASTEPPAALKRALDLRLFGDRGARPGFWSGLALWRGIAAAATAAFVMALALPWLTPAAPPMAAGHLAASLRAESSNVTYLVLYDSGSNMVSLAHMTGDPVEGRDFQLWIAQGAQAPVSLGVIPAGVSTRVAITEQIRGLMSSAAHMAISLEPPGGSPTGQPTGPVLAVGDLLEI